MAEQVRVRFAPSPTGLPHIGNIRTALFNWLFARHHGGKFIVRIEDTDQERLVPEAVDAILDGLEWLDIDWDEGPRVGGPFGPYFQSERLSAYQELAEGLIRSGHAYRCYCTRERLDEMRREQQQRNDPSGYDRRCRHLTLEQADELKSRGGPPVIRFAMPTEGVTEVHDLIRGRVEWQNDLLDDFVILKSDGFPTYHLAVVADDHSMEISHVLRAEEWLPSTPRHLQLYQALSLPLPQFGHLPMILGPDRAKLSKRHGATPVQDYRDAGYLPEAVWNFLVLLGWSLDDKSDLMGTDVVVDNFSLERITKSAAIFDSDRLMWMNGQYIRQLSTEALTDRMLTHMERDLEPQLLPVDRDYLARIVPLVQERLKLLSDSAEITSYFFQDHLHVENSDLVQKGMDKKATRSALDAARGELGALPEFTHQALEESLRATAQRLDLSPRQFFGVLRVAATGRSASPPLFETLEVLGREKVLGRVESAMSQLD